MPINLPTNQLDQGMKTLVTIFQTMAVTETIIVFLLIYWLLGKDKIARNFIVLLIAYQFDWKIGLGIGLILFLSSKRAELKREGILEKQ